MSFFQLHRKIYWDNNATTAVSSVVAKKMDHVLRNCFGNPSSLHRAAHDSAAVLSEARENVAKAVGANSSEILFTGSASEANNQILKSMLSFRVVGRNKILVSPTEHQSVISTIEYLATHGMEIIWLPLDSSGRVNLEQAKIMIDAQTALVCAMYVNNETGVIQDVASLAKYAHMHGALMMADCVQALGKIPVDVKALDLDYAVFSAHKIHGPKGVGALYAKETSPLEVFVHGGHQEHGLRAGTESIHNIAGFGVACNAVSKLLQAKESLEDLRNQFWKGVIAIAPQAKLNVPLEHSVPNTLSIQFPNVANAMLMGWFDFRGIAVSAGSACNTQENKASHVLTSLGISEDAARETIRISFGVGAGHATNLKDVKYVLKCLQEFFGKASKLHGITPMQLNENMLFDANVFILDVRHGYDRKLLRSLPGAHEAVFPYRKQLHLVPKGKRVIVVCQAGFDAPVIAYALRSLGHKDVAFLLAGMLGYRIQQAATYQNYAGQGVQSLAK